MQVTKDDIIFMITVAICTLMIAVGTTLVFGAEVDNTKAVIHHTASGEWTTMEDIRRWHVKERGWDDIGYHKVIFRDGTVKDGRPLWKRGAHARTGKPYSRNGHVGIALVGYDEFTDLQLNSLKELLTTLGVKSISRHHRECPGPGVKEVRGYQWKID